MSFIELIDQIKWIPSLNVAFIDIVQIIILALVLYYLAKSLYKTRAWILVKGLLIIGAVYVVICLTKMTVLQIIMQSLFSALLIAIIIMLQPELQKIVELIGQKGFTDIKAFLFKYTEAPTWCSERAVYEITAACETMSAAKTGALIVVERGIPLKEYVNSGIHLGSAISSQLLINIFEKNTPLHDGAVIITNNKIESATCYLPLSMNYTIDKNLGTRHRAALGISESTDCVVIVVSEETGAISFCVDGNIRHNINRAELLSLLKEHIDKHEDKLIDRKKSKTPVWMKVAAPIISVAIWMSIISVCDPIVTDTITNVPVTAINTESLDKVGQTYTIKSGSNISVMVKGRRSLVDKMTKEDITATADFSSMSIVYAVPITVKAGHQYENVEVVAKTDIMKIEIEDMVQVEIPIEVKVIGNTNKNHVVALKEVEADVLVVTCPQSLVKTLDKAILAVDAYGKENSFVSNVAPVIYDKSGNKLETNKISLAQNTLRVTMNVYEVKEIPIKIILAEQDTTADAYYLMNGYTVEKDTIRVAADDDTIANVQEINITVSPDINSENANSILVNLKQYIPDDVYLAKNQPEQLSVKLDLTKYQKKIINLSKDDIKMTGYDTNKMTAKIASYPTLITLYYNTSVVDPNTITLETLNPTIKIQDATPGTYTGTIVLTDIEGVLIENKLMAKYNLAYGKR